MLEEKMMWQDEPRMQVRDALTALSIGETFLAHIRQAGIMKDIYAAVDSKAIRVLEELLRTLDDETLDDPECYQKIEKILRTLESNWLGSQRHGC